MSRVRGIGVFSFAVGCGLLWPAPSHAQTPAAAFPPEPPPAGAEQPAPAPAPAPAATEASVAPAQQPAPATQPVAAQPPPPPPAYPPPPAAGYPPPPPPAAYPYGESPLPAERPEKTRDLSLTISPLHLIMPFVELQAEVRVVEHLGIALIGGLGSVTVEDSSSSIDGETFSVYEFGGQVVGYPIKDFKSLQLGGEVLWIRIEGENIGNQGITGLGEGVAVGPLVGYKLITEGGFTFFVQGGVQYVAIKAEASDNTGETATAEDQDTILLLNVNLGWSL